jgi:Tetratricopeptide repeat
MRSKCIVVVALSVVVGMVGCKKRVPISPLPPPPPPATATAAGPATPNAPATPSAPPAPVSALDLANRAFISGSYDEAVRGYEDYLRTTSPGSGQRDDALFHLGLIYATRPAPATDWTRAISTFKQLIDEYPNSPLKSQANLILSLRADLDQAAGDVKQRDQKIRQLTTELDRLKKIDADRRRRPNP